MEWFLPPGGWRVDAVVLPLWGSSCFHLRVVVESPPPAAFSKMEVFGEGGSELGSVQRRSFGWWMVRCAAVACGDGGRTCRWECHGRGAFKASSFGVGRRTTLAFKGVRCSLSQEGRWSASFFSGGSPAVGVEACVLFFLSVFCCSCSGCERACLCSSVLLVC